MIAEELKPYPDYKDSGQPWLGNVPARWQLRRAKYVLREIDQRWTEKTGQLLSVSQYTGVTKRRLREGSDEPATRSESLEGYKVVAPNDLAVNIMLAWNGSMGVSPFDGVVSPAYCVYRFREGEPWYFHALLRSPLYRAEIKRRSRGVVESRLRLYTDDLFRMRLLVPPPDEQSAIVRFLGAVDRRVNRLVRAKRRLIELLTEQKQALITHAVTRGLNPDAKLKPSGTAWGGIPERWEVTQLYRVTDPLRPVMYGIVLPGPDVDDGVPIVKGGNCEPGRLKLEHLCRTTREIESRYVRSRLQANDIVYSIRGSIGAAELVPAELTGANLTQDAARIAPGDRILSRWLLQAVRSLAFFSKLEAGARGATIRGINIRDLKRADIAVPPPEEQAAIASAIEARTRAIEEAIVDAKRETDLIREYRTRMVADAVTGKIDVRDAAANLSDDAGEIAEPLDLMADEAADADESAEEVAVGEDE